MSGNKIIIRRSAVAGKVPTASQLLDGELGVNTYDGAVYMKKVGAGNVTSVVEVGGAEITGDVTGTISKGKGNLTLKSSGVVAGAWGKLTVNEQGIATKGEALALSELGDVLVSNPVAGQILQYGTKWSNVTPTPTSASGLLASWTPLSGGDYYADFVHGLGTTNVVVSLYDTATNALVQAGQLLVSNVNQVRVIVTGNTRTLRITVIANGLSVGSAQENSGSALGNTILEGPLSGRPAAGVVNTLYLAYDAKTLYRDNGSTWEVALTGATQSKTMTFFPASMDSPNTTDFAINAMAPVISDPLNSALSVRSFSNTVEQGVSVTVPVPAGATTVDIKIRGRSTSTHTGTAVVQHRLYRRTIPENAAMPAWSSGTAMNAFTVPTNAYFQTVTQTFSLASLGMAGGTTVQIELTRMTGVTNNLAFPWLVSEFELTFN